MSVRYYNLFEQITSDENIQSAYTKTQKGRLKYHFDSLVFSNNLTINLGLLKESILSRTYDTGPYYRFTVYDPKERIIDTPSYPDKIVQHMINNVLSPIYRKCYIHDSYSCIVGKGTHAAVLRVSKFMKLSKRMKDPYIVRIDIKKFFYSIDREILKRIIAKKIKCTQTLWLINKIVDSSPEPIGLPLGCTTSQLFSNIYLNEFDQYVKRKMGIRYYVRYADDAMMIVEGKDKAKECLGKSRLFIEEQLNMKLNDKKSMVSKLATGANIIGFFITTTHRKLRRRSKKRIKRKIRKMKGLIESGRMTILKANQIMNSWLGHARFANSHNFIKYLTNRFEYVSYYKSKKLSIKKYRLCNKDQDRQLP